MKLYAPPAVCLAVATLFGPVWGIPLVAAVALGFVLLLRPEPEEAGVDRELQHRIAELESTVNALAVAVSLR